MSYDISRTVAGMYLVAIIIITITIIVFNEQLEPSPPRSNLCVATMSVNLVSMSKETRLFQVLC